MKPNYQQFTASAEAYMRQALSVDYAVIERRIMAHVMATQEQELRRMLSCWVSECEPAAVYQDGTLLGLGLDGDPELHIVVPAQGCGVWITEMRGRQGFPAMLPWSL